jgi:hypothetical protein
LEFFFICYVMQIYTVYNWKNIKIGTDDKLNCIALANILHCVQFDFKCSLNRDLNWIQCNPSAFFQSHAAFGW